MRLKTDKKPKNTDSTAVQALQFEKKVKKSFPGFRNTTGCLTPFGEIRRNAELHPENSFNNTCGSEGVKTLSNNDLCGSDEVRTLLSNSKTSQKNNKNAEKAH